MRMKAKILTKEFGVMVQAQDFSVKSKRTSDPLWLR
jgi:hypothetical protein